MSAVLSPAGRGQRHDSVIGRGLVDPEDLMGDRGDDVVGDVELRGLTADAHQSCGGVEVI